MLKHISEDRDIEIRIYSDERQRHEALRATLSAAEDGTLFTERGRDVVLLTPELFSQLLSPERLKLLLLLGKGTESISELARKANRRFEVVHRDLALFARYKMVHFTGMSRTVMPRRTGAITLRIA